MNREIFRYIIISKFKEKKEYIYEKIHIIFSDKGPGIPDIEKAMQEGFSTASHEIRELGFGAGMGLPNMKRYTDSMRIESEIGKGTTIYMTVLV